MTARGWIAPKDAGKRVKEETSCDEDDEHLSEHNSLADVMKRILTHRRLPDIVKLAEKLATQDINHINSFKALTKKIIETKLSEHLNIGQIADVLEVKTAVQASHGGTGKDKKSKGWSMVKSKCAKKRYRNPKSRGRYRDQNAAARSSSRANLAGRPAKDEDTSSLCMAVIENNVENVWPTGHRNIDADKKTKRWSQGKSDKKSKRWSQGKSKRWSQGNQSPKDRDRYIDCVAAARLSSKASLAGRSAKEKNIPLLWTAVVENDVEEVRRLLSIENDVEESYQGWTPLMAACERGYFSIALLLLDYGADIKAVNSKGRCALSFAAAPSKDNQRQRQRVSQLEIIKLLASRGAQVDRRDANGKTPRDHAKQAASQRAETSKPRWRRGAAAKLLEVLENS